MTEAEIRAIVRDEVKQLIRPLFLAIRQGHKQADAQIERVFELADKK